MDRPMQRCASSSAQASRPILDVAGGEGRARPLHRHPSTFRPQPSTSAVRRGLNERPPEAPSPLIRARADARGRPIGLDETGRDVPEENDLEHAFTDAPSCRKRRRPLARHNAPSCPSRSRPAPISLARRDPEPLDIVRARGKRSLALPAPAVRG